MMGSEKRILQNVSFSRLSGCLRKSKQNHYDCNILAGIRKLIKISLES